MICKYNERLINILGVNILEYPAKILIMKMSFWVKHCKRDSVVLSKSAQVAKLKKTYRRNTKTTGNGYQLLERGQECLTRRWVILSVSTASQSK